jgi:hypothetical protein
MRRWPSSEQSVRLDSPLFHPYFPQILGLGFALWLVLLPTYRGSGLAMDGTPAAPRQHAKQTSPHVGSAMAVLATLQQAAVLPPEGTHEADRVIQAVIQLQSVFAKGTDPSIQEFARRALTNKYGNDATTSLEQFRASGWTAGMLEALADADSNASSDERETLAMGLRQFNLSVDDFRRFMQLVRDGRSALTERGLAFEEVYTHHRNTMPGAAGR